MLTEVNPVASAGTLVERVWRAIGGLGAQRFVQLVRRLRRTTGLVAAAATADL
jgi:hypothetical protein